MLFFAIGVIVSFVMIAPIYAVSVEPLSSGKCPVIDPVLLNLEIPCAGFNGNTYSFTLDYNGDLHGWTMNEASLLYVGAIDAVDENCAEIDSVNLNLTASCADYFGTCYSFVLNYDQELGMGWRLAPSSFTPCGDVATFTVSGNVVGSATAGVNMALAGENAVTTETSESGSYTFAVKPGSYTITPSLAGYAFTPATLTFTVTDKDISDLNFTAELSTTGDETDYESLEMTEGGVYSSSDSGVQNQNMQYASATSDIPAVKVSGGGSLSLTNSRVIKSGDTASRENSGFYGFNAGVLASSSNQDSRYSESGKQAEITMTNCTISTDASGANGAFAFGENAVLNLDHVTILTTGSDNSRGVDGTYGGTVNIYNSSISTMGGSCAALASDRYDRYEAPKINAVNCIGTTAGSGSPGIYCTGTFNVSGSTLTATGSEAAVIEGLNSISLTDTDISGAKKWGVMIYQSMSGDASIGTGTFTMTGGSITNSSSGPLFFVCNTTAVIELTAATLKNNSDTLLWATTAAAGSAVDANVNKDWGKNGGTVTFTATDQNLEGNIVLEEETSSILLNLVNSSLKGAVNSGNKGTAALILDSGSSWEVTEDSYVTSLTNNGGSITGSGVVYVNGEILIH